MAHARKRHHTLPDGKVVHLSGWKPDRPDHRDALYMRAVSPEDAMKSPPQSLDQWPVWKNPMGIYNQGQVGDCTANGGDSVYRWPYWKMHAKDIPQFSRFFLYAETRKRSGVPLTEDSGASIRDMVMTMKNVGMCPEAMWPSSDESRFTDDPTDACREEAAKHRVSSCHSIPNLASLKHEISNWYPVVFGFPVYTSFMSDTVAKTGVVPIPAPGEDVEGGHCVIAIGYCDQRKAVLCMNSWGTSWGDGGFFWLPYWFFTEHLASDMWVCHTETGVTLP